jgi:hypothetical protein
MQMNRVYCAVRDESLNVILISSSLNRQKYVNRTNNQNSFFALLDVRLNKKHFEQNPSTADFEERFCIFLDLRVEP